MKYIHPSIFLLLWLFPLGCFADEMRSSTIIHGGVSMNGMDLIAVENVNKPLITPLGPKKMFEQLTRAASVTSSEFSIKEGGEVVGDTKKEVTASTTIVTWPIDKPNTFFILQATKTKIFYAPVTDFKKVSYFDGTLKSYHYLQRQVFGPSFKDIMADKY